MINIGKQGERQYAVRDTPSFWEVVLVESPTVAGIIGRKRVKVFACADAVDGKLFKHVVAIGAERFRIENDRHVSVVALDVSRGLT